MSEIDNELHTMSAAEFKTRREALGATQQWVARRLGHTAGTVKRWEAGKCAVPLPAANLIRDAETWATEALADIRATLDPPCQEPGSVVTLIRYLNDSTFYADFGNSKYSASIHAMWVARVRESLAKDGYTVVIKYAGE